MYAIIEDSGTQIKVAQGDIIKVDTRQLPDDAVELTFDRVLMIGGGEGQARIGAPALEGVWVTGDIVEEGRDKKVAVVKFRRRKDYTRQKSHRQNYLKVRITAIHG